MSHPGGTFMLYPHIQLHSHVELPAWENAASCTSFMRPGLSTCSDRLTSEGRGDGKAKLCPWYTCYDSRTQLGSQCTPVQEEDRLLNPTPRCSM